MKGAIACGHIETAKVAKEIIDAGGNAFDAAIAALSAMFVTEPCMASLGGGGFALIRHQNKIHQLDFFCKAPFTKSDQADLRKVIIDFGGSTELYYGGQGSVAVPGVPALLQELHRNLASLPLKELLQPAIELAKDGVALNWFQQYDLKLLSAFFQLSPERSYNYFIEGEVKQIGSRITNAELADTLDFIAHEGIQDFYRGDIATLFFDEHISAGGQQTRKDWLNYEAKWGKALQFNWNDQTVYTAQLPSIGGLLMRSFLSNLSSTKAQALSPEHYSLIKQAYESERPYRKDKKKLETRYPELKDNVNWENLVRKGTSHFNILDGEGNAISLTSTVGSGSGMFIGNTGIYLNNMLGEEGLLPDGINSWKPGVRLHSSTSPTIVTSSDHSDIALLGSGGSTRIPYAIAQVLVNQYILQQSLEDSIKFPRIYDDLQMFQVEPGFELTNDTDANVWHEKNLYFGGVHAVHQTKKNIEAVGDNRREGYAEVW